MIKKVRLSEPSGKTLYPKIMLFLHKNKLLPFISQISKAKTILSCVYYFTFEFIKVPLFLILFSE